MKKVITAATTIGLTVCLWAGIAAAVPKPHPRFW